MTENAQQKNIKDILDAYQQLTDIRNRSINCGFLPNDEDKAIYAQVTQNVNELMVIYSHNQ